MTKAPGSGRRRASCARGLLLAAALTAVVVACGGSATGSVPPSLSPTASILPPATDAAAASGPSAISSTSAVAGGSTVGAPGDVSSPLVGVVVAIDSAGLGNVSGFTVRLNGGQQVHFSVLAPLENAASFALGHLSEHVASAAPVRVFFRRSADLLVVYRIEDAG